MYKINVRLHMHGLLQYGTKNNQSNRIPRVMSKTVQLGTEKDWQPEGCVRT